MIMVFDARTRELVEQKSLGDGEFFKIPLTGDLEMHISDLDEFSAIPAVVNGEAEIVMSPYDEDAFGQGSRWQSKCETGIREVDLDRPYHIVMNGGDGNPIVSFDRWVTFSDKRNSSNGSTACTEALSPKVAFIKDLIVVHGLTEFCSADDVAEFLFE